MNAAIWLLWVAAAALAVLGARWLYRRREPPGHGRGILAGLRGGMAALLLLLLFDPALPAAVQPGAGPSVLVDASLSMQLPSATNGRTRWQEAVDRARKLGGRVTLFGDATRVVSVDSLSEVAPAAMHTRLLPALQAAAEAGQHEVTVVTDGAIEDADQVARWLPRLGLRVKLDNVGGSATNRGLVRVLAPAWAETGQPIEIAFEVAAQGEAGTPLTVTVKSAGRVVAQTTVTTPAQGRVATGTLRFVASAPEHGEQARYDVSLDAGDGIADDDARSVYVRVSAEPQGAVMVSFAPDWEPRFLQPVLERSLGMPVRGFLRTGTWWVSTGTGLRVGGHATEDNVRHAVEHAELLVLHALGPSAPEWAKQAAASAQRVLVIPAGDGQVAGLPLPPTGAVAGDWYLSDDIPPSPVAALLTGLNVKDLPPLTALRIPGRITGAWSPANVSRGRRGAPYAVALGGTSGTRRWVVGLGEGYWRWAFWSDASREVYERLWSALAGWLVGEQLAHGPDAVEPATRVVPRAEPVRWVLRGTPADSLRIKLTGDSARVALDTTIVAAGDTVASAVLPPGRYTYEARTFGEHAGSGAGEITVESFSAEFTRPGVIAALLEAPPTALAASGHARTPLHATVWPYLLLIVLLSVEWVLRRRWGLR